MIIFYYVIFLLLFCILTENWKSPVDKKIVRGSNVQVLTSHVDLNPRSKHASLSLSASLAALRAGYEPERRVIKVFAPAAFCCWCFFLFFVDKNR